jgi:hypothetical protein
MTMFRRGALSGLAWRTAASALCVLLLAACPDGYPTEDAPLIEPSRMTQVQLLAALNELGAEPHLGKRWRYALHANCELAVSVRNGDTVRQRVVLEGATFGARSADGVTEILLLPKDGGAAREVAVLATRRWSDTVKARSLLSQLEMRCGSPAAPTA